MEGGSVGVSWRVSQILQIFITLPYFMGKGVGSGWRINQIFINNTQTIGGGWRISQILKVSIKEYENFALKFSNATDTVHMNSNCFKLCLEKLFLGAKIFHPPWLRTWWSY